MNRDSDSSVPNENPAKISGSEGWSEAREAEVIAALVRDVGAVRTDVAIMAELADEVIALLARRRD